MRTCAPLPTQFPRDHPVSTQAVSGDSFATYQRLEDIYGKPVGLMRVLLPRTIHEQGRTSLVQFLLLLMAMGLVFGAVTLKLLEKFVVSRIANLSDNVTQIGASGNLAARLDVSRKGRACVPGHGDQRDARGPGEIAGRASRRPHAAWLC